MSCVQGRDKGRLKKLKSSRNGASSSWFSVSKVFKRLDRLGTSTSTYVRQVKEEEVDRYLDWDLNHNTLVVMHQLILRQGGKGMAIGGYLSSWAAELWCLWKEHITLSEIGHKETLVCQGRTGGSG